MHRAFLYGPRMRGMTHAGQFEPSPHPPPTAYPAAPYANLRTPDERRGSHRRSEARGSGCTLPGTRLYRSNAAEPRYRSVARIASGADAVCAGAFLIVTVAIRNQRKPRQTHAQPQF